MTILSGIFAASLFPFFYCFLLYPILLSLATAFRKSVPVIGEPRSYSVSVLLPLYNEEAFIARKLDNILATTKERVLSWEIMIYNDGSTDRSAEIITSWCRNHKDVSVVFFDEPINRGKWHGLTVLLAAAQGEVILLSDISALLPDQLFDRALGYFDDTQIAAVAPSYNFQQNTTSSLWEKVYWPFERYLKSTESSFYSTVGAHGAAYLVRKTAFPALNELLLNGQPPINDDFMIPTFAARGGRRIHYLIDLPVWELESSKPKIEYRRRLRIAMGNLLMGEHLIQGLQNPVDFRLLWICFSHKILRSYLGPSLLITGITGLFMGSMLIQFGSIVVLMGIGLVKPLRASVHALILRWSRHDKTIW